MIIKHTTNKSFWGSSAYSGVAAAVGQTRNILDDNTITVIQRELNNTLLQTTYHYNYTMFTLFNVPLADSVRKIETWQELTRQ
jgi:hypothetical protein